MTVERAMTTAITGLSAATVALFGIQMRYTARLEADIADCQRHRYENARRIAAVEAALVAKQLMTIPSASERDP